MSPRRSDGKLARPASGTSPPVREPVPKFPERPAIADRHHRLSSAAQPAQVPNLRAARAFARAATSSRFFGGAVDSSETRSRPEILAISSTAEWKAASFDLDGLLKPLIFLTNCSDAARISSSVTGGLKLKSVLMFLHIPLCIQPEY